MIGFCLLSIDANSQNNKRSFEESLSTALRNTPTDFSSLDFLFYRYKRDTTQMRILANASEELNYLEGNSYAQIHIGSIYRNLSQYDKAIDLYKNALTMAETNNNIELRAICLNMLGVVYRRMDLVRPALDYHTRSLDLAKSEAQPTKALKKSIAVSQNSMGNIYLTLKQYDLAIKQFSKSLSYEIELNNRLGLAINHQNIGSAKESKGQLDDALKHYQTSLDYNNQLDSDVGRVICYNSIGRLYIKQGKFQEAKNLIGKNLEKAIELKDQFYIASSYLNMGIAESKLKAYDIAKPHLLKAIEIGDQYNFKSSNIEAHNHMSEILSLQGEYRKSLQHYKSAITLENTINSDMNLQYVNDIILQYENENKNRQIKALSSENEIVKSKLLRNEKLFWFTLIGLILISIFLITLNRQRQLKQEKQILTLEQDMLRSQMNPHFIFNSLNSIKLYIINNEKENAVYYLNKFSKLIRKILVSSTEKEISLMDELETMQLYMNIENIRFSNEINFNIEIGPDVNTANIRVPSLILQPFLENALWHGLSSKSGEKQIKLMVSKPNSSFVSIAVTDNGIGRTKAEKINHKKLLKRKSLGLAITKARLANFSKAYTDNYSLQIEDLYDENHTATGTKVVVHIPLQLNTLKTA
ncbi:MAG: sensor histidine kinase [Bacteroidetes bacterium MedPE-SWsnd-G2]|nr:MAG: sensor histidine kinase [Bacteroidetes bacterium MedPE-SWsnd-G2]